MTRYRVRGRLAEASARTHNWGLDETGTIDMSGLLRSREEIQQQEEIDIRRVSEEVLQVHGVLPGRKEEGITRLLYENANGIYNRLGGNEKLDKAKDIINELGADIVAYNEHRQNLRHKDNRNGWNQLFRGGEADVRSVVAHNDHEADRIDRVQEGGTGLLMFGPLTDEKETNAGRRRTGRLADRRTGGQDRRIQGTPTQTRDPYSTHQGNYFVRYIPWKT
jgi:hypothetical protein